MNFIDQWERWARAERKKDAADLARRWAEGSRMQRCLDHCEMWADCMLHGCKNIPAAQGES